jgi:hypothetical protein
LEQHIAVDYLRELAALQARAGSDSALMEQIAREKEKASSQAASESRTALVGKWIFKWGDQALTREFKENGTFIPSEHGKVMGKWAISGEKVVLSWYNGGLDESLQSARKAQRDVRESKSISSQRRMCGNRASCLRTCRRGKCCAEMRLSASGGRSSA